MSDFEPRIVAFFCNWCTYGAADLAGVSRLNYPPNFRVVRLPCSGRMNPKYILEAFKLGADGVWVSGCHPGDCHYIAGNYHARRKFVLLHHMIEAVGVEPGRLHFSWISSAEATKLQEVARDVVEKVRAVGPNRSFRKAELDLGLAEVA
ncbi:MAG: hydrogenase iron-sulfur subunit [Deltaproteobacteria bacterium]|nr:hydrogenase iron-sulfur subunit [Deltaproteobacteria bacterium]